MLPRRYSNSECRNGYLHKFYPNKPDGKRFSGQMRTVRIKKIFPQDAPNLLYLYNIRRVLRADDPLFKREYPDVQV